MGREIYLLWSPQGWGVFDECSCPDPENLPNYWYRQYEVPEECWSITFKELLKRRDELVKQDVIPTRENYSEIFRDIFEEPSTHPNSGL